MSIAKQTLCDNLKECLLIQALDVILDVVVHQSPQVLPRTNKRQCPNVVIESLWLLLSNPKQTLERLITSALTVLNLISFIIGIHLNLTCNHTKVEWETKSCTWILSPNCSLVSKYFCKCATSEVTSLTELVNKS